MRYLDEAKCSLREQNAGSRSSPELEIRPAWCVICAGHDPFDRALDATKTSCCYQLDRPRIGRPVRATQHIIPPAGS